MKDLTGQRFGRLVVIKSTTKRAKNGQVIWHCICDCGNKTSVISGHLYSGHTKSCGCLSKEGTPKKHGLTNTKIYEVYHHMKQRCCNPDNESYKNYGGRGIKICDEWLADFMNFYNWAMANGYREDLTIDRIDNNKGYSPENCRWATRQQQCRNTRRNKFYKGKCFSEWSEILGIHRSTFQKRVNKHGIENVVTNQIIMMV